MIILNEIHSDKMEFLIYALKTHTFKVLVANEDKWRLASSPTSFATASVHKNVEITPLRT